MRQELAALRLGYLGQEMRSRQRIRYPSEIKDLEPCLQEIKRCLYLLGGRVNGFQGKNIDELLDRISARHGGASEQIVDEWICMLEDGCSPADAMRQLPRRLRDNGIEAWMQWQDEDWADFQTLLGGIVGCDANLGPWFATGDHFGDVIFQLTDGKLGIPLSQEKWDYLYAGVDRLPELNRIQVNKTFPRRYRSGRHLSLQLVSTFTQLCDLLAKDDGRQVPYWDAKAGKLWFGSILVKHFKRPAQNQRIALDAFQQQGFKRNEISNPFALGLTPGGQLDKAIDTCMRTAGDLNEDHVTPNVIRFGHRDRGTRMTCKIILDNQDNNLVGR